MTQSNTRSNEDQVFNSAVSQNAKEEANMMLQLEGDYAQGLRTAPLKFEGADYARGLRTLPSAPEGADYARGLRTLPYKPEGPDYARGLRSTAGADLAGSKRKGLTTAGAPAAGK